MGGTGTAHSGGGARAEIRKRQNRDSARRSREKRKSHLRGVAESVELQSRRVRELDARVAQLEALVHRAVRPRTMRSAAASASTGASAADASTRASPATATPMSSSASSAHAAGASSTAASAVGRSAAGRSAAGRPSAGASTACAPSGPRTSASVGISANIALSPPPVNPDAPPTVAHKRSPGNVVQTLRAAAHPRQSPASAPPLPSQLKPPTLTLRPSLPASARSTRVRSRALASRSAPSSLQAQPQPVRRHAQLHPHSLPPSGPPTLPTLPTHDSVTEPVPFAPSPIPTSSLSMAMVAVGSMDHWGLGDGGLDALADASNGIDGFMADAFERS